MSNFTEWAVHPETGKIEQATYLDDHFGRHMYGVRFADGLTFPSSAVTTPVCDVCGHDFADHALPGYRTYCLCEHPGCECENFVLQVTKETKELFEEVERAFSDQEPRPCRGCQQNWTPTGWNFYGLCDQCFPRWNAVRVRLPCTDAEYTITPGYYSSCSQWIADGCPDKPDEPFRIHFEE